MPWDTEDWSLELAADGATERSMHDINANAPDEVRSKRQEALQKRKEKLKGAVSGRGVASTSELKERNRKKLDEFRRAREKELPEGWKRVESRSRPGTYVYENIYTDERQAWLPTEPAVNVDAAAFDKGLEDAAAKADAASGKGLSEDAKERNRRALAARKAKSQGFLPEGWRRVESNSRPGTYVYENVHTEERVAWYPTEVASEKAMPAQSLATGSDVQRAKALYDYVAATNEEIDLEEGDLIIVEFKADNGWWIGTNSRTGMLGMFPGGFVEIVRS